MLVLSERVATLSGVVTVDDAEPLTRWLRETALPKVRLARCTHLHTAVLQALLATQPEVTSLPTEFFLSRWIAPLLTSRPVVATPTPSAPSEEIH